METHTKKMGRPLKLESALSHNIRVRIDDELHEMLCSYCERTGKRSATVVREGLRYYLEATASKEPNGN